MTAALSAMPPRTPGVHVSPGISDTITYAVVDAAGCVLLSGHVRADCCDEAFLDGLRRFYRRQGPNLRLV